MATLRARVGELETTRGRWRIARECSDSELLFIIGGLVGTVSIDAELMRIAGTEGATDNKEGAGHGRKS